MDCEFTEEVSLLVDGELAPHEAARLRAHIEGCAACRQSRETFLLLRQELRSYDLAPDPHAQSKTLAAILGSRASAEEVAPSAGVWAGRRATRRGIVSRLFGSLDEAFSLRRLRPAYVAAAALLLIATALGLRWFMASHAPLVAQHSGAPASANTNSQPARTNAGADAVATKVETADDVDGQAISQAKTQQPPRPAGTKPSSREGRENAQVRRDASRTGRERREGLNRELPQEAARVGEPAPLPASASAVAPYSAENLRAVAADPSQRIGRHAERVERLLRSFRNAPMTGADTTLEVADARRLSKRLLYNNIALRREAASAGDLPVEGLLDSVEPILIDISNLPNAPTPAAVGSIKERIQRRQLVGILQVQVMLASR
jgi:anti-sigma factor RsiW